MFVHNVANKHRISALVLPIRDRTIVPCMWCTDFSQSLTYFKLAIHTIGGKAVTVVRIVVVDCPRSVDITHAVGISRVRRPQPPVPFTTIALNFIYRFYTYYYLISSTFSTILFHPQQVVSNI